MNINRMQFNHCLRVVRVIALIAQCDVRSNFSCRKWTAQYEHRIQSSGRRHVVGIVSQLDPEKAELVRDGKRAIHVCKACHAWPQLHRWEDTKVGRRRKGLVAKSLDKEFLMECAAKMLSYENACKNNCTFLFILNM